MNQLKVTTSVFAAQLHKLVLTVFASKLFKTFTVNPWSWKLPLKTIDFWSLCFSKWLSLWGDPTKLKTSNDAETELNIHICFNELSTFSQFLTFSLLGENYVYIHDVFVIWSICQFLCCIQSAFQTLYLFLNNSILDILVYSQAYFNYHV